MKKPISEIVTEAGKAASVEAKAEILQRYDTVALRQLLKAAFDPNIVFDVEIPKYKPSAEVTGYTGNNLYVEFRRLYIFLKESKVQDPRRKSILLTQVLETIDAVDAKFLVNVIEKDLSSYNINAETVKLAFPGLL